MVVEDAVLGVPVKCRCLRADEDIGPYKTGVCRQEGGGLCIVIIAAP